MVNVDCQGASIMSHVFMHSLRFVWGVIQDVRVPRMLPSEYLQPA